MDARTFLSSLSDMSGAGIGFVGLGNMGVRMAMNLVKQGKRLKVFDVDSRVLAEMRRRGVMVGESPAEVARECQTIITMLPSSPQVREVYLKDEHGIMSGIAGQDDVRHLIDCSTIDPGTAIEVGNLFQQLGHTFVDAPVSGGVVGAEQATLTFMVGGSPVAFEHAQDILRHMGRNIVSCGPLGTGQTAKIVNNLILGISMIGVSEGMNLGRELGIDPKVLASIINTSSGRCWSSDTNNPCPGVMEGVPSSRGYEGGFACRLMKKDLGLAIDAAESVGVLLPLGKASHDLYAELSESDKAGKDFSSVFQYLSEKNGRK